MAAVFEPRCSGLPQQLFGINYLPKVELLNYWSLIRQRSTTRYYYYYYIRLTAFFQDNLAPER